MIVAYSRPGSEGHGIVLRVAALNSVVLGLRESEGRVRRYECPESEVASCTIHSSHPALPAAVLANCFHLDRLAGNSTSVGKRIPAAIGASALQLFVDACKIHIGRALTRSAKLSITK